MKTIRRIGGDCALWDGRKVKTGETVSVADPVADLLVDREPNDWSLETKSPSKAKE